MHILCDISHPAHVHFFRNAINIWKQHGHEVTIVSRDKDLTIQLLDHYQFNHTCLSIARKGMVGLGRELLEHEGRLFFRSLRNTPDVFIEIAGTFIVHAAKLVNRPSIVFYDTEHAKLSNSITYPFATAICTPSCYTKDEGKKHIRYNSYHEIAYLHPNYYKPDPNVLNELGINANERFFLVRFVNWEAAHDVGLSGFSYEGKRALVNNLSKLGRVIITSEARLPVEFEQFRMRISPTKIHDVLYYCSLYIGEGGTMASEAAILGTPSIYVNPLILGYLQEEEKKFGLVFNITNEKKATELALELASDPEIREEFRQKSRNLLAEKIDVTSWMVSFVEEIGTKKKL